MLNGCRWIDRFGLLMLLCAATLPAAEPGGPELAADLTVAPGSRAGCGTVDPARIGTGEPATCSLQAALDWAAGHGDPSPGDGRVVITVRPGSGVVAAPIVVRGAPGVTLELEAEGVVVAPAEAGRPAVLVRTQGSPVVIRGLAIRAPAEAMAIEGEAAGVELAGIEVTGGGGIRATGVSDLSLHDVGVAGALADGLAVEACDRVQLEGVRMESNAGNGLRLRVRGRSRTVAELEGVTAERNGAAGVAAEVADDARLELRLTGSRLTANNVGVSLVAEGGELAFEVVDNGEIAGQRSHAVNLFSSAASDALVAGRIVGNRVIGSRLGAGIRVALGGAVGADLEVSRNHVSDIAGDAGIALSARNGSGRLTAVLAGNRVEVDQGGLEGIMISTGGAPGDAWRVCAALSGNLAHGGAGQDGIRVEQRRGSEVLLDGVDRRHVTAAAAAARLQACNPGSTVVARADDGFTGAPAGCRGW